jgi:hypothetical protein
MDFAMDFHFAGHTNLPYAQGPHHAPPAKSVDIYNCQACLRTALGCGSAPNPEELDRCQAMARGVDFLLHKDSTPQAHVFSTSAGGSQCAELCTFNTELQYGSGYVRPFVDTTGPGSATM